MKNKTIFSIIAIVCLFVCTLIYYWKAHKLDTRDYPQIAEEGVLRIVTDYNPNGYYISGDTATGFNAELIKLLQQHTDLKIEILLESDLKESVTGIRTGKYDVLIRHLPITSELRVYLNFTKPLSQNRMVLVQRKLEFNDSIAPIRSHLQLAQKTLYLPLNSPAIMRVKNLSSEIGDTIYSVEHPLYGAEQLAYMVSSGEIDYAVCDENTATSLLQNLPEIDIQTYIGFTQLEAWAVRYDSPILLDSLDTWISNMKMSPQYNKLIKQYNK